MLDFEDNIKKILEDVEDEENIELDIYGDEEEEEDFGDEFDYTADEQEPIRKGRRFEDFVNQVWGPPRRLSDDEIADPLVKEVAPGQYERILGEPTFISEQDYEKLDRIEQKSYRRVGDTDQFVEIVRLPTGKMTDAKMDALPPELKAQYKQTFDGDWIRSVGRDLDTEYIGTPEDKWMFDDVYNALIGSAKAKQRDYFRHNTAEGEALTSIMNAWLTDLGKAPFSTHVFSWMKSAMRGVEKVAQHGASLDAPVGSGEGEQTTMAAQLAGEIDTTSEREWANKIDLIKALLQSPDTNLTSQEQNVAYASVGLKKSGAPMPDGPMSNAEIARLMNVTPVRVSQIKKKIMMKMQDLMAKYGIGSEEEAMRKFGIDEAKLWVAAKAFIDIIMEIAELELKLLQETYDIPVDIDFGGYTRHAIAKVNADTFEVDDVIAEGNESILMHVGNDLQKGIKEDAKFMTSKIYFAEMVNSIIDMQVQPVLGVVGINSESETEENGKPKKQLGYKIKD